MKSRRRSVFFYELQVKSSTRSKDVASPYCIDMRRALEMISSLKSSALGNQGRKSEMTVIEDWRFDASRNEYHILINRADRDVPDVALKDFDTRSVRYAGKKPREGIDISTHIIIRLNRKSSAKTALVLVTQGGGMTMNRLERLFNLLMQIVKKVGAYKDEFIAAHPSGAKGDTYKVSYSFALTSHKSSHLDECLKQGRLVDMELITIDGTKFDTGGNLFVKSASMHIVPGATSKHITLAMIQNAISSSKQRFDQARIKFKSRNGSVQTQVFPVEDLEAAFTKRAWLNFDTDIPSHTTKIDDVVIDKMIEVCK